MLNEANAANVRVQAQLKELSTQVAALQAENARLAKAGEVTPALRAELDALKTRLAEAQKGTEQHGTTVAELTGLNEKLAKDKTALERQLAQTRQSSETARAEIADLRSKVAQGDRALQEQLAMVNEANAANERVQSQLKELAAQVANLRGENARLAGASETGTALRTELDDVKARLAEMRKAADKHGETVAELTAVNEKLAGELKAAQTQIEGVRTENARLAQSETALREVEQRAAALAASANQLTAAQRELQGARTEIARLNETVQALERDRTTRVAALQQENAAITARLRQAQGTLDQIASAARLMNAGGVPASTTVPPTAPIGAAAAAPSAATNSAGIVPAPRFHVVVEGDSLTRISMRYYGTSNRWQEIYEANRELLKGENALRPGQRLRVP